MRRALERKASTLGIAWATDITDVELERLINDRKERGLMTETNLNESPPCYGLYWEAIPGTEACVGCAVNDSCLQRFVTDRLPILRQQVGNDLASLAAASEVKAEAILVALDHEKKVVPMRQPETADVSKAFDTGDPAPTPVPPEEAPIPQAVPVEEPTVPIQVETEPDPEEASDSGEEVAVSPKTRGKKKKAPTKKKKVVVKKAAKKKAKKKAAKKAKVQNPPVAGPVKRAKVPAKKRAMSAAAAKAQASPARKRPPPNERQRAKHLRQWLREREKNPMYAVATPGTRLHGIHKGQKWEIKVLRGHYVYRNKKYPTLQSVCNAITGLRKYQKQRTLKGKERSRPKGTRAMSNWSAKRFFNRALQELSGR